MEGIIKRKKREGASKMKEGRYSKASSVFLPLRNAFLFLPFTLHELL